MNLTTNKKTIFYSLIVIILITFFVSIFFAHAIGPAIGPAGVVIYSGISIVLTNIATKLGIFGVAYVFSDQLLTWGYEILALLFAILNSFYQHITAILISAFIISTASGNDLLTSDFVRTGWTLIRDFVNILIVFALMWSIVKIIYKNLIGEEQNEKKTIIKYAIAAVLVNLSGFFAFLILDLVNIATALLIIPITNSTDSGLLLLENVALSTDKDFSKANIVPYIFIDVIMRTLIVFLGVIFVMLFLILLILKFFASMFLIITSPITTLCFINEPKETSKLGVFFNFWKNAFSYIIYMPVILAIVFFLNGELVAKDSFTDFLLQNIVTAGGGGLGSPVATLLSSGLKGLLSLIIMYIGLLFLWKKVFAIFAFGQNESWKKAKEFLSPSKALEDLPFYGKKRKESRERAERFQKRELAQKRGDLDKAYATKIAKKREIKSKKDGGPLGIYGDVRRAKNLIKDEIVNKTKESFGSEGQFAGAGQFYENVKETVKAAEGARRSFVGDDNPLEADKAKEQTNDLARLYFAKNNPGKTPPKEGLPPAPQDFKNQIFDAAKLQGVDSSEHIKDRIREEDTVARNEKAGGIRKGRENISNAKNNHKQATEEVEKLSAKQKKVEIQIKNTGQRVSDDDVQGAKNVADRNRTSMLETTANLDIGSKKELEAKHLFENNQRILEENEAKKANRKSEIPPKMEAEENKVIDELREKAKESRKTYDTERQSIETLKLNLNQLEKGLEKTEGEYKRLTTLAKEQRGLEEKVAETIKKRTVLEDKMPDLEEKIQAAEKKLREATEIDVHGLNQSDVNYSKKETEEERIRRLVKEVKEEPENSSNTGSTTNTKDDKGNT